MWLCTKVIAYHSSGYAAWDLFRYPGVRSDSDMYTNGYRFRPWRDPKAIADGPAILSYIRETAVRRQDNRLGDWG
jgi:cation diffusion facilitator CzcD-associated flavoprotein CzcO